MMRLLLWSLRHRRWRHVLNGLTIAITVAVVMVFVAVVMELLTFTRTYAGRDQVRINVIPKVMAMGGAADLPMAYGPILEKIDGVTVVQRQKALFGRDASSGATYFVSGEEPSGIELNQDFFPVAPDVFEAWKKEPLGAIITEATAKQLDLTVGETIDLPTPSGPLQLKVVGFSHKATIAHRIAVHFEYLHEFMGNSGTCTFRLFASSSVADRVPPEIERLTQNSPTPATAFTESQFAAGTVSRVAVVPALLGFLGAFLLLTTALTLANNNATSIRERRMETATLRVLGYRRSLVGRLLLGESVLVGVVGGLFAVAITWFFFRNGVHLTVGPERLLGDVKMTPLAIGCGLAIAILVPLAGALPATLASLRVPLVKALRDSA